MKKKLIFIVLFFILTAILFSEVPNLMNYQGILTDDTGQPVTNGEYEITFKVYNQESGGNPVWSETQNVLTNGGIFHVLLGSINAIIVFPSENAWLGIQVGVNPEMTPRKRIASVGYSFITDEAVHSINSDIASFADDADHANTSSNSDALQGYNADDFVLNSDYFEPITVFAHTASVMCPANQWTTLLEVDITIPETSMIFSFGTVEGAGWVDGWRMLQLSIYNQNYSQFYSYANPFGDVATAYHILPSGTYHIQLYGDNMTNAAQAMTNISVYGFALKPNSRSVFRVGPFSPPPNAILPNPR